MFTRITKSPYEFRFKLISISLVLVFLIPSAFFSLPPQAHAQFGIPTPTIEIPGPLLTATSQILVNTTAIAASEAVVATDNTSLVNKEFVLDGVAWFLGKVILQSMTSSIVKWINTGFKGNPSFVSNPLQFFANVSDKVAGDFLLNDPSLNFLCSPFGAQIRISLNNNRLKPFDSQVKCTLTGVVKNIDAFTSNFANGGWAAWDSMTQNDANNPYGAYFQVTDELWRRQNTVQKTESDKLAWGQGFLSSTDAQGNVETPGSVIQSQLETQLGTGVRTLESADEINEVLAALIQSLTTKVVSTIGGGLRGLGNGSSLDDGGAQLRSLQTTQMPPPSGSTGSSTSTTSQGGTNILDLNATPTGIATSQNCITGTIDASSAQCQVNINGQLTTISYCTGTETSGACRPTRVSVATGQALATQVQTQGTALGYTISCQVTTPGSSIIDTATAMYYHVETICNVNGLSGVNAESLLSPNGWSTLNTSLQNAGL